MRIHDLIVEQIKNIDVEKIVEDTNLEIKPTTKIVESQKVYFWIRVYLKESLTDIKSGDQFELRYLENNENLKLTFVYFGKKGLNQDYNDIVNYSAEDDEKILCLMVDENDLYNLPNIQFLRSLFKQSKFFEYQVYRRDDLIFTNLRTNQVMDYIDCDF